MAGGPEATDESAAAKYLGGVLFLSQLVDRASEVLINVKGRPFSTGILDSDSLVNVLLGLILIPLLTALEVKPSINQRLDLPPWGGPTARLWLSAALAVQLLAPLVWDAVMLRVFAPDVWRALRTAKPRTPAESGALGQRLGRAAVCWYALYRDAFPWDGVITTLATDGKVRPRHRDLVLYEELSSRGLAGFLNPGPGHLLIVRRRRRRWRRKPRH
jgi:hypothetical protein